jgi:hypothetical protein
MQFLCDKHHLQGVWGRLARPAGARGQSPPQILWKGDRNAKDKKNPAAIGLG